MMRHCHSIMYVSIVYVLVLVFIWLTVKYVGDLLQHLTMLDSILYLLSRGSSTLKTWFLPSVLLVLLARLTVKWSCIFAHSATCECSRHRHNMNTVVAH